MSLSSDFSFAKKIVISDCDFHGDKIVAYFFSFLPTTQMTQNWMKKKREREKNFR